MLESIIEGKHRGETQNVFWQLQSSNVLKSWWAVGPGVRAALTLAILAIGPGLANSQAQLPSGGDQASPRQVQAADADSFDAPSEVSSQPKVVRCQRGLVIKAEGSAFRHIVGTMAVPGDWPGQQRVRVVKEELPPGATVSYRTLEGQTRQMTIRLPSLAEGAEVRAVVTFEVELLPTPSLPSDVPGFAAPAVKKLDRKLAACLTPSPLIESNRPEVRELAEKVAGAQATVWDKAKAVHAWVYENIKFVAPAELGRQNVLETLRQGTGVCAEKNSLVVALLRALQIPARLVRITSATDWDHCYYEFYLVNGEGTGVWFAGDASTRPALDPWLAPQRVVLQKGDSVTVTDRRNGRKVKQRFLESTLSGLPNSPSGRLGLRMIGQ